MARLALVLVSVKLVKNWQAECAKFLDTNDLKLDLKVYIGHRSATQDVRIGKSERKEMMTPRGT